MNAIRVLQHQIAHWLHCNYGRPYSFRGPSGKWYLCWRCDGCGKYLYIEPWLEQETRVR